MTAYEVKAEFVLDELELGRHAVVGGRGWAWAGLKKADSSLRSE